jgi:hypothetical protein
MYGYDNKNDYRILAMIAMTAIRSNDDRCHGDHEMMMMTVMPMMMIVIRY